MHREHKPPEEPSGVSKQLKDEFLRHCLEMDVPPTFYLTSDSTLSKVFKDPIAIQGIHLACRQRNTKILCGLLEIAFRLYQSDELNHQLSKDRLSELFREKDRSGNNVMHIACANGHMDIVTMLYDTLEEKSLEPSTLLILETEDHKTPLHIACEKGHRDIANFLIQNMNRMTECNSEGLNPLHLICKHQPDWLLDGEESHVPVLILCNDWDLEQKSPEGHRPEDLIPEDHPQRSEAIKQLNAYRIQTLKNADESGQWHVIPWSPSSSMEQMEALALSGLRLDCTMQDLLEVQQTINNMLDHPIIQRINFCGVQLTAGDRPDEIVDRLAPCFKNAFEKNIKIKIDKQASVRSTLAHIYDLAVKNPDSETITPACLHVDKPRFSYNDIRSLIVELCRFNNLKTLDLSKIQFDFYHFLANWESLLAIQSIQNIHFPDTMGMTEDEIEIMNRILHYQNRHTLPRCIQSMVGSLIDAHEHIMRPLDSDSESESSLESATNEGTGPVDHSKDPNQTDNLGRNQIGFIAAEMAGISLDRNKIGHIAAKMAGMDKMYEIWGYHLNNALPDSKNNPILIKKDDQGRSPLDKFNAILTKKDDQGRSPLWWAASSGNTVVLGWLLDARAPMDADSEGNTPLQIATEKGHLECIEMIQNASRTTEATGSGAAASAAAGEAESKGTDTEPSTSTNPSQELKEWFMYLCQNGRIDRLLNLNKKKLEKLLHDEVYYQGVQWACQQGDLTTLNALLIRAEQFLERSNDKFLKLVTECNASGYNAFHIACAKGNLAIVTALFDAVRKVLLSTPLVLETRDQQCPLRIACQKGHRDIAEFLIKHLESMTETDSKGSNPLDLISSHHVEWLIGDDERPSLLGLRQDCDLNKTTIATIRSKASLQSKSTAATNTLIQYQLNCLLRLRNPGTTWTETPWFSSPSNVLQNKILNLSGLIIEPHHSEEMGQTIEAIKAVVAQQLTLEILDCSEILLSGERDSMHSIQIRSFLQHLFVALAPHPIKIKVATRHQDDFNSSYFQYLASQEGITEANITKHSLTPMVLKPKTACQLNTMLKEASLAGLQVLDLTGMAIKPKKFFLLWQAIMDHPCLKTVKITEASGIDTNSLNKILQHHHRSLPHIIQRAMLILACAHDRSFRIISPVFNAIFGRSLEGEALQEKDALGRNVISFLAAETHDITSSHFETMLNDLKAAGVDLCAQDSMGQNALGWAASTGHTVMAQWLIENHAPMTANNEGKTPLDIARAKGHLACVKTLLDHYKTNPELLNHQDATGCTIMHHLVKANDTESIAYLLDGETCTWNPDLKNHEGQCAEDATKDLMIRAFIQFYRDKKQTTKADPWQHVKSTPTHAAWDRMKDIAAVLKRVWKGKYGRRYPTFNVSSQKERGAAVGSRYQKAHTKPDARGKGNTWLGKIGTHRGFVGSEAVTDNNEQLRRGLIIDAMREKIAGDMYLILSRGAYIMPKHRLAQLPLMNSHRREHLMAQTYAERLGGETPMTHVMSKWVMGYKNLKELVVLNEDGRECPFMEMLEVGKIPEKASINGRAVPIFGLMELLAVARLMGDTDVLSGGGENAGFVLEKDFEKRVTAVRVVNIDPGFSFNFKGDENRLYNCLENSTRRSLEDPMDLQYGNACRPTLKWKNLSDMQQSHFLQAFSAGLAQLKDPEFLKKCLQDRVELLNEPFSFPIFTEAVMTDLQAQWLAYLDKLERLYKPLLDPETASAARSAGTTARSAGYSSASVRPPRSTYSGAGSASAPAGAAASSTTHAHVVSSGSASARAGGRH